ncbi:hypothetical protein BJ741DRAFT_281720 [Chytriomyces cf. hyalinus JEL632]|nr:hypothetical protein BJ741DRAFT_281720 [Chytriomyces cf. hyalinus JEL632]
MGKMLADPHGAAETGPMPSGPLVGTTGWFGRNLARCVLLKKTGTSCSSFFLNFFFWQNSKRIKPACVRVRRPQTQEPIINTQPWNQSVLPSPNVPQNHRRVYFTDVGGGLFLNMSWWKHVGFIQAVIGKSGSVKISLGFTHTTHVVHFKVDSAAVATRLVARIKKLHKKHLDTDLIPIQTSEKVPSVPGIPAFTGAGLKDFVSEPQQQAQESDSDSDSDSTVTLDF